MIPCYNRELVLFSLAKITRPTAVGPLRCLIVKRTCAEAFCNPRCTAEKYAKISVTSKISHHKYKVSIISKASHIIMLDHRKKYDHAPIFLSAPQVELFLK